METIRAAQDQLGDLIASGWVARDELLSVTLEAPPGSTGSSIASGLRPMLHMARDVRMRLEVGVNHFELGLVQGALELIDTRAEDLRANFDGADLQTAQRARAGDTQAAIDLPGSWTATASFNLAAPLTEAEPTCAWRVVRGINVLEHSLSRRPWWRLTDLIDSPSGLVVYVVLNESELVYVTDGFAVVGVARVEDFPRPRGAEQKRTAVRAAAAPILPEGVPLPEQLVATPSRPMSKLAGILRGRAGACAWAWLGNSVTAEGEHAEIEFFGFRRVQFSLGADGIADAEAAEESLNLYRWATAEASPDRVLAVRQVVSLSEGPELPSPASDVRRAAEPLFMALRSEAVTEVLRSQREARAIAIKTARKSSEAAQSASKSVVERTIASLAAVGGVALASASKVITSDQGRNLALAIGAYLLVLVLWSILVEGPPITNPLGALQEDLKQVGDLLSAEERTRIMALRSVKLARRRAIVARLAAPLAYLAGAVVALIVAGAQ